MAHFFLAVNDIVPCKFSYMLTEASLSASTFCIFYWSCLCKFLGEYMFSASLSKHQGCSVVRAFVQLCEGEVDRDRGKKSKWCVFQCCCIVFMCTSNEWEFPLVFFSLLIYLDSIWCCQSFGFWPFYQGVECLHFLRTNIDYKQQVPILNRPDFVLAILPVNRGVIFFQPLIFLFNVVWKEQVTKTKRINQGQSSLSANKFTPLLRESFVVHIVDLHLCKTGWTHHILGRTKCNLSSPLLLFSPYFLEQRRKKTIDFFCIIYLVG